MSQSTLIRVGGIIVLMCGIAGASKVGDVAAGKVLTETDTALSLQVKPCGSNPETLTFSAPWKKRFLAVRKCPNGQKYDEYEVEQSSQFSNSSSAKIGDVADGIVTQQTDDSVTLNTTPCQKKDKVQLIVFSAPFKIRETGEGTCPGGNKYKKSSVEQLLSKAGLESPDWQLHINWAMANAGSGGEVNCPDQYIAADLAACIVGGRQCVMEHAIQAAKAGNCENAFRLTLITQCHNGSAQQALSTAGEKAVCSYLKGK